MQNDALKATIQHVVRLLAQGWTDDKIMEDLARRSGKPAEQFRAAVTRARRGYKQGREASIRKSVSVGIESAFERFRTDRRQQTSRRLGLLITAIAVGSFLTLAAIGAFATGELIPASIVAILAVGAYALFFVLWPRDGASAESGG